MGGHRHAPDRAAFHDGDRTLDRRHRGVDVFPHIPTGRKRPMNAVAPLQVDELPPRDTDADTQAAVPAVSTAPAPPAPLDEGVIAAAMAEAARAGRSVVDVLSESAGRSPHDLAQAVAATLDYRFVGGDELSALEPAFDILPPSEATRRCST